MNPASETLLVALDFARTLERLGIAHLLGGSLASATYGEARTTIDADFAVHMTPEQPRGSRAHCRPTITFRRTRSWRRPP